MQKFKKVGTGTIEFIREMGCENGCSKVIPINRGLPLPCKEFTNMESALLRRRALEDEQLFNSGFTKIIDRSAIGDDLRIKQYGIDIGDIRTEASGARSLRDCKYNYEGIEIDQWEKRFYVVNTNKHLELCPRDLVGSKLSDWIGDKMTDFDEFEDTDLADILIGSIIEKYNRQFVAKFILLAVWDAAGTNMHGDDGVLAKAWYAFKNQYFHTVQYDFANLVSGKSLTAIVGGKKWQASVASSGSTDLVLLNFVNWLNTLKEGREYLYQASLNLASKTVTVVSKFACEKVKLRAGIIDDGNQENWSTQKCSSEQQVITTVLQNAMPVNDVPLMFRYQEINETNFIPLFKRYTKEFMRYLHRNGMEDISVSDIKIGIDPELMLERDDAVSGKYLAGGIAIDFMQQIGLSESRFKPLNALNATGLFFMTIDENILVLGDGTNVGNGLPGNGMVKVVEECQGKYGVIFDNPIGSAVEHFGAFASNLCDSWFVNDNNLDDREPYQNTRETLLCYSDACVDNRLDSVCNISATVETEATYDANANQTNIQVDVVVHNPDLVPTIEYNLGFSTNEGSTQSGITNGSFVIPLPGDQTQSGLIVNVFGNVTGSDSVNGSVASKYCNCTVSDTTQFGTAENLTSCDFDAKVTLGAVTNTLEIVYTLNGNVTNLPLVDSALDISDSDDWSAIENEIEAIFPNSLVEIDEDPNAAGEPLISISNIIGSVSQIDLVLDAGGLNTSTTLTRNCD